MSFSAAFVVLMDRFNAQWTALQPTVPIAWPNKPFSPTPTASWVRVTMLPGDSRQAAIGATRLWRTPGIFVVQCFVPKHQGDEAALALCDSVVAAMRGVTVSGIRLRATSSLRVGEDNQWLQYNATTPYEYDDVA